MKATLETLSPFSVVGLKVTVDDNDLGYISSVWSAFNDRLGEIVGAEDEDHYGLTFIFEDGPFAKFDYMPAVRVAPETEPPDGMIRVDIEEALYAVFKFQPVTADLPHEFRRVYQFIENAWLPDSGYRRSEGPDVEIYRKQDFDPVTHAGTVSLYIPVTADA